MAGQEAFSDKSGTPSEREKRYTKSFYNGLRSFRDKVLEHDWSCYNSEKQKTLACESMWEPVVEASSDLEDLYFEMGLQAGVKLGCEMYRNLIINKSEDDNTMSKNNGEVRKIDDLGRIVIPKNLRNALDWQERDALRIIHHNATQVILERANPTCFICGEEETLVQIGNANICESCRKKLKDAENGDIIEIEQPE